MRRQWVRGGTCVPAVLCLLASSGVSGSTIDMCYSGDPTGQDDCTYGGCAHEAGRCNVCSEALIRTNWITFRGSQYKRMTSAATWGDAVEGCKAEGATLASFTSDEEFQWAARHAQDAWIGHFQPIGGGDTCSIDPSHTCSDSASCPCAAPHISTFTAYKNPGALSYRGCLYVREDSPQMAHSFEGSPCPTTRDFLCKRPAAFGDWVALSGFGVVVKSFGPLGTGSPCAQAICQAEGGVAVSVGSSAKFNAIVAATGVSDFFLGAGVLRNRQRAGGMPVWLWDSGDGFTRSNGVWSTASFEAALVQRAVWSGGKVLALMDPPASTELVCQRSVATAPTPLSGQCSQLVGLSASDVVLHLSFEYGTLPTLLTNPDGQWPSVPVYGDSDADVAGGSATGNVLRFGTAENAGLQLPSNGQYGEYPTQRFAVCFRLKFTDGVAAAGGAVFSLNYNEEGSGKALSGFSFFFDADHLNFQGYGLDGTQVRGVHWEKDKDDLGDSQWHHICGVHGVDRRMRFYVDGVEEGSDGGIDSMSFRGNGYGRGLALVGNDLHREKAFDPSHGRNFEMDELVIFSVPLTAAQVASASGCGVSTPAPPTDAPPTPAPATLSPPTPSPATSSPATAVPPTLSPPTPSPPTPSPATVAPPTLSPPTSSPSTSSPLTPSPPTSSPPTPSPATVAPPTLSPPTSSPSTLSPPTPSPATSSPATAAPPTLSPQTPSPPTPSPPTAVPPTLSPPTSSPSTSSPLTPSPPTSSPPTPSPPTVAPPTLSPPTASPATLSPPTPSPATSSPPTVAPPTLSPLTPSPLTPSPATASPPTVVPSTLSPPTPSPLTLSPPTAVPSTLSPSTSSPPTLSPPTPSPATSSPPTAAPPTLPPPTPSPPTPSPATSSPPTVAPQSTLPPPTASPSTLSPSTPSPATSSPLTRSPATPSPPTAVPPTLSPPTSSPPTSSPLTPSPATSSPATAAPPTLSPPTPSPATPSPTTSSPPTVAPPTSSPSTPSPATSSPPTAAPPTLPPQTPSPPPTQLPATASTPSPPTAAPPTPSPPTVAPPTPSPPTPPPPPPTESPATLPPLTRVPLGTLSQAPAEGVAPAAVSLAPGWPSAASSKEVQGGKCTIMLSLQNGEWQHPSLLRISTAGDDPAAGITLISSRPDLSAGFHRHALRGGYLLLQVEGQRLAITLAAREGFRADLEETLTLRINAAALNTSAGATFEPTTLTYVISAAPRAVSRDTVRTVQSVVGAVSSVGSPMNAGRTTLLLRVLECPIDLDANEMSWVENPLSFRIESYASPEKAGAVLGNFLLVVAVLLVHFGAALGVLGWRLASGHQQRGIWSAMSRARFPSYTFFPAMLFYQGTIESGVHILRTDPLFSKALLPVCVLLFYSTGLLAGVYWVLRPSAFPAEFKESDSPSSLRRKALRVFTGKGDYRSPDGNWFVWMFGLTFRDYYPAAYRFMLVEIGLSATLGVINGIEMESSNACRIQVGILLLFLAYLATLVYRRPYHALANNVFAIGGVLMQTLTLVCAVVHLFGSDVSSTAGQVAVWFVYASLLFLIPKSLLELAGALYDIPDRSAPDHTRAYRKRAAAQSPDLSGSCSEGDCVEVTEVTGSDLGELLLKSPVSEGLPSLGMSGEGEASCSWLAATVSPVSQRGLPGGSTSVGQGASGVSSGETGWSPGTSGLLGSGVSSQRRVFVGGRESAPMGGSSRSRTLTDFKHNHDMMARSRSRKFARGMSRVIS